MIQDARTKYASLFFHRQFFLFWRKDMNYFYKKEESNNKRFNTIISVSV